MLTSTFSITAREWFSHTIHISIFHQMMLSLAATGMLLVSVIAFLTVDLFMIVTLLFGVVKSKKISLGTMPFDQNLYGSLINFSNCKIILRFFLTRGLYERIIDYTNV